MIIYWNKVQEFFKKYFNVIYLLACGLVFIVISLRAFFIPFSHDEASTFFFYIQSDNYLPYLAHVYTNNHVLNSALANLFYHLFGSHRFILRLPNILSFILLACGVFKYFKYLGFISSRVILSCLFIFTFNFLDFFELCRGYGLSIALMVLGLAYLLDYFKGLQLPRLVSFTVCWQLALAANLTLVVASVILLFFILIFQLKEKLFFNKKNLVLHGINLLLLAFWVKFSFFYKSKGVLDSGVGENYWVVSFKSLMLFIFGTDALWLQVLVVMLSVLLTLQCLSLYFKSKHKFADIFSAHLFFPIVLGLLVLAFYLQKQLLHVNYPEDRTGLFFYIFFVLSLVFFFDSISRSLSSATAGLLFAASFVYFVISYNIVSFSHYFYHVLPRHFYTYLENEHKKTGSCLLLADILTAK